MKVIPFSALLLFAFFANANAQEPVPLAHGNVPGEPHHHLKIDNEYVRAYYVEVPPHEETQLHQHDHDYIFVTLGDSDVINAVRDKPEVHLVLKDGETRFTRGGFAHVARNLADTPFRNITIELLHPQGNPQNLCSEVVPGGPRSDCTKTIATLRGGHGFTVEPQLETAAAFLNLVRLDPETRGAGVAIQGGTLVVALNESEVQLNVKGKPTRTLHGGEMIWIDIGLQGTAFNPSKESSNYLQLVFADSKDRKPGSHCGPKT